MSDSVAEVRVNTAPATILRPSRRELTGVIGQTLEMRCNVRATQAVVWTKDGGVPPRHALVFGPILTILNLQSNDAGRYVCESQDTSEYIDLSVEGNLLSLNYFSRFLKNFWFGAHIALDLISRMNG